MVASQQQAFSLGAFGDPKNLALDDTLATGMGMVGPDHAAALNRSRPRLARLFMVPAHTPSIAAASS